LRQHLNQIREYYTTVRDSVDSVYTVVKSALKKGAAIATVGAAIIAADYALNNSTLDDFLFRQTYAQDGRIPPPPGSPRPKKQDPSKPATPVPRPAKPNPQKQNPAVPVPKQTPAVPVPNPKSTGAQRIVQEQPAEPVLVEMGAAVNSNKTTKGSLYHISLSHDSLEFRGLYDFEEWKNLINDDMVERTIAANLRLKPLEAVRILNHLGAKVSQSVVDFLTFEGAVENIRNKDKNFQHLTELTEQFKTITDTSTQTTTDNEYLAGGVAIKLLGLGLRAAAWQKAAKTTVDVDQATYIENLTDPNGNQSMSLKQTLENKLKELGIQAELSYEFKTGIKTETSEIPVSAIVSLFADYSQIEKTLIDGTKQNIKDTLVGLGVKGQIADCLAFNIKLLQELYDGPDVEQNGWKDTSAFASIILQANGDEVKNEKGETRYQVKTAFTLLGWYKNNENWGAGLGTVIGSGKIKLSNLENIADQEGMRRLRLYRTAGEAIESRELERTMRMMPLALEDGVNFFAYGFVLPAKDKNNQDAIGGEGYAGLSAGPFFAVLAYSQDPITRKIGVYTGVNVGPGSIVIGVKNETDNAKKEDSQTGEVIVQFPLG